MDVTVVDTDNPRREPGEKPPDSENFVSAYVSNAAGEQFKTLSLPDKVISNLLDFRNNDYHNNPSQVTLTPIGGVGLSQSEGGSSSFSFGYNPAPPTTMLGATVNMADIQIKEQGAISKDP